MLTAARQSQNRNGLDILIVASLGRRSVRARSFLNSSVPTPGPFLEPGKPYSAGSTTTANMRTHEFRLPHQLPCGMKERRKAAGSLRARSGQRHRPHTCCHSLPAARGSAAKSHTGPLPGDESMAEYCSPRRRLSRQIFQHASHLRLKLALNRQCEAPGTQLAFGR